MSQPNIIARYRIETCLPLEQVAETIAGEQSSGTFLPVPGETEELKARSRAKVTHITLLDTVDAPSLQGGRKPKGASGPVEYQRAEITSVLADLHTFHKTRKRPLGEVQTFAKAEAKMKYATYRVQTDD
ncbi:MAG: ribulose 1,5-bisphosphate carboxylase, partial [Verrucomicrobia bacterium]|nr:ribulose 1,5-bisphosphate carboxylase [Verrucomicrobiota bacterium]